MFPPKKHTYIPKRLRPDYSKPTGYIAIKCKNNQDTNFLDHLSSLLRGLRPFLGKYAPPMVTPEMSRNLGSTLPDIKTQANLPTPLGGSCICELFHPSNNQCHATQAAPTSTGRTHHIIETDVGLLVPHYPALAAALKLPTTYIPNEEAQAHDKPDIIKRLLAKLNEWAHSLAPKEKREYIEWIGHFKREAEMAIYHPIAPAQADPLTGNWRADLIRARKDGICISKCDKSNSFVWMCSTLPDTLLQVFMSNPARYEESKLTAKQVTQRNKLHFKDIFGSALDPLANLPLLIPSIKNHKAKKDHSHPYREWPIRPVTSYANRGNSIQQKILSLLLSEVENFHYGHASSHVVKSSVDFLQKLRLDIPTQYSFDAVGFFDNLDLQYASYAIGQLLKELYAHKQATHRHAHMRINRSRTRVYWVHTKPKRSAANHFPIAKVHRLLDYLLNNDYVTALGKIFRSVAGCPMGANASSKICSLVAYFAERTPLREVRMLIPNAQMHRYADDIHVAFSKWIFELYFTDAYAAAGFTLEAEEPIGLDRALPFLEATIKLGSGGGSSSQHYSQRQVKFAKDRMLPHKGGATSSKSQRTQLQGLVRRQYHSASNSLTSFLGSLKGIRARHPEYTGNEVSRAARAVITNTEERPYDLTSTDLSDLLTCIRLDHYEYDAHHHHTRIYLRP